MYVKESSRKFDFLRYQKIGTISNVILYEPKINVNVIASNVLHTT